jgi:hypothetical protein
MIYILRKSKRFVKDTTLKKTLTDAKFHLYNLSYPNFLYSDFYVVGSDYAWEMEDLLNFFSETYLKKVDKPAFDMYFVDGKVTKPERQSKNTLNVNVYNRLKEKIQKEFVNYSIALSIKNNRIAIQLENHMLSMNFFIDDHLNILDATIKATLMEDFQYLSILEETRKVLDRLFVKQRYYYKNKGKLNDDK